MKYIYYILSISFLFAQGFEINQYYGTLNIDEEIYDRPFLGGLNKPKIQWIDWDNDGDSDPLNIYKVTSHHHQNLHLIFRELVLHHKK